MPETHIPRKDDNVRVYVLVVAEYIGMIEDDEPLASHHSRGRCWSVRYMSQRMQPRSPAPQRQPHEKKQSNR